MSCPNLALWVEMVSLILAILKLQLLLSISTNSRGVVSCDFFMKAYYNLKFYSSCVQVRIIYGFCFVSYKLPLLP